MDKYGLTTKDALTLMTLDNGDRLDYFMGVVQLLKSELVHKEKDISTSTVGKLAGNWYVLSQKDGVFY